MRGLLLLGARRWPLLADAAARPQPQAPGSAQEDATNQMRSRTAGVTAGARPTRTTSRSVASVNRKPPRLVILKFVHGWRRCGRQGRHVAYAAVGVIARP